MLRPASTAHTISVPRLGTSSVGYALRVVEGGQHLSASRPAEVNAAATGCLRRRS